MSYSHDGDRCTNRVLAAIGELIDAMLATGDPICGRVNPAAIRWLNEALGELDLELVRVQRTRVADATAPTGEGDET
jgi:hypothetical protein